MAYFFLQASYVLMMYCNVYVQHFLVARACGFDINYSIHCIVLCVITQGFHDKWVPVTTSRCILRLWMEERPQIRSQLRKY